MHSFEANSDTCNFLICGQAKLANLNCRGPQEEMVGVIPWLVDHFGGERWGQSSIHLQDQLPLPSIRVFLLEEGKAEGDVEWEAMHASINLNDYILEKMVLSLIPTAGDETLPLALGSAFCSLRNSALIQIDSWRGHFTDAIYWEVFSGDVDWTKLLDDLVFTIAGKLTVIADYVSFRSVCMPWRRITSPRPSHIPQQSPWLMHSFEEGSDTCNFLCMERSKTYKIQLRGARNKICCGSSHGWLIFLEVDGGASMFNPLTQDYHQLPSTMATSVYLWKEGGVDWEAIYASSSLNNCNVEKMVLSSSPTSGQRTVTLALVGDKIAFCRHGDPAWTLIGGWPSWFTDAIYHEGKFFIVDCMGTLFTLEIGSIPKLKLKMPPMSLSAEDAIQRYVVEMGANVLMICRVQLENERWANGKTVAFEVYMLDCSKQLPQWIELKTIGGYSLFIGANYSISVSSKGLPGFKEDCIYFTDDFYWSNTDEGESDPCLYNDQGIYNLVDKSIVPLPCSPLSSFISPTPKWLIPSL